MVAAQSPVAMDGPSLRTRLRRMKQKDIEVAQESLPPPTFTVPALRARRHRGGESDLLKATYPSGFCKPPENRPLLPITTTMTKGSGNSPTGSKMFWSGGSQFRDLLHESKEVGVSPCGIAAGRRALNVTRVVVGARDVVDAVGSELVHFAGFSVGPAEQSSPRKSADGFHHPRLTAQGPSPSRVTIDGSALTRSSLYVEPKNTITLLTEPDIRAPSDSESPQDKCYGLRGRKRIRPARVDRDQPSGGPGSWLHSPEKLTGRSSGPGRGALGPTSLGRKGRSPGRLAAVLANSGGSEGLYTPGSDEDLAAAEAAARPLSDGSPRRSQSDDYGDITEGDTAGKRDSNIDETTSSPKLTDQGTSIPAHEDRETNRRNDRTERMAGEPTHFCEDGLTSRERLAGAWGKDHSSIWSDGSASLVASIANNDNTVFTGSLVGCDSGGYVSGKRSFSTLGTERYRGSLSKDATNILRSHLESRSQPSNEYNSDFSASHSVDAAALISPAAPPTIDRQLLDHVLAADDPRSSAMFHLPPKGRSPAACYVRTRGDIVLAVVRKSELLECDDGADLQAVKAAAHPVRIKSTMTMAEGMRAILASGVLRDVGCRNECTTAVRGDKGEHVWRRSGAVGGTEWTHALEYYDSKAGAWQHIRNDSDWKILLAAQASPRGVGVVFHAPGAIIGRDADFLVTVSPSDSRESDHDNSQPLSWLKAARKLKAALMSASTRDNLTGWRYVSPVTPGALRSQVGPTEHDWDRGRDGSGYNQILSPGGGAGGDPTDMRRKELLPGGDCRAGSATARALLFPEEETIGIEEEDEETDEDCFRWKLARLVAGRRRRIGPGPGAALWMPSLTATTKTTTCVATGTGMAGRLSQPPKKAKVRCLVRHLEAGLKLKGCPGAGGFSPVGSQRVDLPYTKELMKWSYDEILGIPQSTVSGRRSR